ncbi:TraB/GumN family protein [Sinorhizobium sp. BG8]|uniref:TraB/GumN family protein n=1 Tax=Sinorhizobium sp. BG8 TaxID=2613773 RepID=UPI00193C9023|nr:TraB/GumN family protein [Sinorhizobium sp. BG8]QRM53428.1 polysaccharide biosynthesis protein GumN [Sinorhizobium sp. BG8]
MVSYVHRGRAAVANGLAEATLWLMAGLHVLAALSFVAVLFAAAQADAAEEPASCGGANILAEIQESDPAMYQRLVEEAGAAPNGKGIFWKVEKEGTAPSYLLGTMHVTDPRVLAMPEAARSAYAAASTVVIESDEIADEKKAATALLAHPELTMFMDGRTITDLLDKHDVEVLSAGLKKRGLSLAAVSRMKPWMLASFVALPACELARKAAGASFLDQKLAKDAIADGKTLKGLETLLEQISSLDSLPLEPQLEGLVQTVALGDQLNDVIETMSQLYLAGDIGMIMPMMRAAVAEDEDGTGYADFEQRIIIDRNHRMAERGAPILDGGNVFMAVGALHLPGEEGLIELFRKQGFVITRVQ